MIGICHAGVTAPSTLLAMALEEAGIPCVVIATSLGRPLAAMMSSYRGHELAVLTAAPVLEGRADVEEVARALIADVASALTCAAENLPNPDPAAASRDTVAGPIPTSIDNLDDLADFHDTVWEQQLRTRIGDGLPIVVPTRRRTDAMIGTAGRDGNEIVIDAPTPNGAPVTVEALAANAVLAGCLPEHFPIVLAAAEAMSSQEFRFFQSAITSHPGGVAVIVSGPLAEKIGLAAGPGCMGPGFRANATIGRAVHFIFTNIVRAIPGISNLATFGSPAQFTFCFAESDDSPWPARNEELGDRDSTVVTVLMCESPHNVFTSIGPGPGPILDAAASVLATLGSNAIRWPTDHLILVNPGMARTFAAAGMSKRDVQMYLFDKARVAAGDYDSGSFAKTHPTWVRFAERIPVVRDPAEFHVIVTGGIGHHLMVAPPWGPSRAVTRLVRT